MTKGLIFDIGNYDEPTSWVTHSDPDKVVETLLEDVTRHYTHPEKFRMSLHEKGEETQYFIVQTHAKGAKVIPWHA